MKDSAEISSIISEFEKRETELKLDIEQLKSLNQELKISERQSAMLNSIVEGSNDGIISKDLNGIITSWNPAAEKIFGYTSEEMIDQSILKLIPLNLYDEEQEILASLRAGKKINHYETKRLKKDGNLVDVSLTISPIFSNTGQIIGVSKIVRDISFLKMSEVERKILSAIITTSDDAIISKDLNGIVTSWNEAAYRIFGYLAEEMIGKSILTIIPTDRQDEETKILSQLKQGIRVDHFETIRVHKNGSPIHVSLTISPLKDNDGKVIGLSKIARDITDKKLAEKKKDEFIGFVSHELKTPLTSLRSYVQVALHKAKKENYEFISNSLSRAELQTRKMENIISNFLNISKFDGGSFELDKTPFNLSELIRECITDAGIISNKHPLQFDDAEECTVVGDYDKISLVLINLISNAQKYSPAGGEICISLTQNNFKTTVAIKDCGIGISAAHQSNMFQKFYRIKSADTRFISGFGIGLYLCDAIIQQHGSKIRIESELGKGSTFSFDLSNSNEANQA